MRPGYIGNGLMGRPMSLRPLAAGHEVVVWNRSKVKLAPVVERGAKAVDSPVGVARAADCDADGAALHAHGRGDRRALPPAGGEG
ncbi:MAG: hypothetical protein FJY40_08505 [Betaproteobacteria bacterium]|nr:hypothetical protein [Betaproteobacteria bacterium]